MKKFFALLLTLAMALSLVACGGNSDTTEEPAAGEDAGTEEPAGETTGETKKIAVVLKTLSSEYWGYVKAGCDAAAEELGVEVTVIARSGRVLRQADADVSARLTEILGHVGFEDRGDHQVPGRLPVHE